jgi:hypothetical protein
MKSCTAGLLVTATLIGTGCGETQEIEEIPQDEVTVTENTSLLKIDNKVFHFQNPVQTALIMKDVAAPYSSASLNPTSNVENYSTSFKQAINIGVYGADLGYITAHGKNQEAINHLAAIKKLAGDLGVAGSFDFGQMEKFGNNLGDQKQMLDITTSAYKSCEAFLKEGDRHDLFGLMMAGALVEGLHFAVSFAKQENNQEVVNRMADQVTSLNNVILVLNPHYHKDTAPELSALVDQLVALQEAFLALKVTYKFAESEIDVENKLCTIKSESTYSINPTSLANITKLVTSIREGITS